MIDNMLFKVTQLTTATATILVSGWVTIVQGLDTGFFFFLLGAMFTISLRLIEQSIFADNVFHSRYRRM